MGFSLSQVSTFAHQAPTLARFALARARGQKFPLMVTLELTDKCNFRCVYCQLPQMNRTEAVPAPQRSDAARPASVTRSSPPRPR